MGKGRWVMISLFPVHCFSVPSTRTHSLCRQKMTTELQALWDKSEERERKGRFSRHPPKKATLNGEPKKPRYKVCLPTEGNPIVASQLASAQG